MNKSFWNSGHRLTLLAAFLYFDLSFMVWVMLGPLGVQIANDLGLNAAQKGLMVATPVLSGALLSSALLCAPSAAASITITAIGSPEFIDAPTWQAMDNRSFPTRSAADCISRANRVVSTKRFICR